METMLTYLYMDLQGIESMYSQTVDILQTDIESVQSKGKVQKGSAKLKLTIGSLLEKLGIAGADIGIDGAITGEEISSWHVKYNLTGEQKLAIVLNHLRQQNILANSLDKALERAETETGAIYFEFEEDCLLSDRDNYESAKRYNDYINEMQFIRFIFSRHPDIQMGGSLYKFYPAREEEVEQRLWPTSHLGIIMSCRELRLKGFGELRQKFYVKPFYLSSG